jgi:hypothetical protein
MALSRLRCHSNTQPNCQRSKAAAINSRPPPLPDRQGSYSPAAVASEHVPRRSYPRGACRTNRKTQSSGASFCCQRGPRQISRNFSEPRKNHLSSQRASHRYRTNYIGQQQSFKPGEADFSRGKTRLAATRTFSIGRRPIKVGARRPLFQLPARLPCGSAQFHSFIGT